MQHLKVGITLSDANVQRLRLEAQKENRSLANFVTCAVLAYLKEKSSNEQ